MLTVRVYDYASASRARGVVVVIDVLRAFTTEAYALAGGAKRIVLVPSVDDALAVRAREPQALLFGEVAGATPPQLDFDNSPAMIARADVRGRTLVHVSSAGTVTACRMRADALYVTGLVTAKATARAARRWATCVSLVISGTHCGWDGDEDRACADLIRAYLYGEAIPHTEVRRRVLDSTPGRFLGNPEHPEYVEGDLDACTAIDRFDFALRGRYTDLGLVVEAVSE